MAKCWNCEWYTCSFKNTDDFKDKECEKYTPHYIDEDLPIEDGPVDFAHKD